MSQELPPIQVTRKTGSELFIGADGLRLDHFWKWSSSDLVSNATRGILAEFLVAAVGQADGVRSEWDAYDLISPTGLKVEVKSAAYIQSWHQHGFSNITFSIRPTRAWDAETNCQAQRAQRQADVYVFALLHHKDQNAINPLDLSQWTFHVISTERLESVQPEHRSITLGQLLKLNPSICDYDGLLNTIQNEGDD